MNLMTTLYDWAHNERLIHSLKTALACLISFVAASHLHFQMTPWIVITTLVVMCAQINVGSVIQKSWMRFLGTLTGSLFSIITLNFFGNDIFISTIVVIIAAIFFSFIATSTKSYSESGTLGAVTVVIILFGVNPDVQTGIERFLEISLGILIAAVVSQFVFPIHAKTHLRRNQAATINKIRALYMNLFYSSLSSDNTHIMGNLDEEIVKSLIMQRKLAGEARKEKWGNAFNIDYFQQSLWCEKEIIRSIIFMFYAWEKTYTLDIMEKNKLLLDSFHHEIINTLENISACISQKTTPTHIKSVNIIMLKEALDNTNSLQPEEKRSIDAFVFCAEILIERLNRIMNILKNTTFQITLNQH